jgi:hypothetical protein
VSKQASFDVPHVTSHGPSGPVAGCFFFWQREVLPQLLLLEVLGKKLAERMMDNGKGTGTMERACVVGGTIGGTARPASKIFSRAGDDLIVQLVDACNGGKKRWTKIALDFNELQHGLLGNRTGKQIHDRYRFVLDPAIDHAPMRGAERDLILQHFEDGVTSPTVIAKHLPGRTRIFVYNHLKPLKNRAGANAAAGGSRSTS